MDTGIAVTALVLVLLCIIPLVIISRNKGKTERLMKQDLFKAAMTDNCEISVYDQWNRNAIGIDKNKKKLFYLSRSNGSPILMKLDLTEYSNCKLLNGNKSINSQSEVATSIDKIDLVLLPGNPKAEEVRLEFYNKMNDSLNPEGEYELAERWKRELSAQL